MGADLANIVNEAALLAARKNKTEVDMTDFEAAIDRIVAGLEKKRRVMNKKEKEIVAYHECGHTIVAELLPTTDPVHRVSIVQRGIAALGYTLQLPTEDRYLMTKTELLDKLCVMLGGRVAEEIIFRRGLDGCAERPPARGQHRAQHGHRVRHDREVRAAHLRKGTASPVP